MTIDARKERFELVEVLGHPMLFTGLRVDRSTVPMSRSQQRKGAGIRPSGIRYGPQSRN